MLQKCVFDSKGELIAYKDMINFSADDIILLFIVHLFFIVRRLPFEEWIDGVFLLQKFG